MPLPLAEFMNRIGRLSLAAGQGGCPLLTAPRAKCGPEAAGRRDYAPGDDYRHIDWAWCARRDELQTRLFPPPAEPYTYFLLDCSASMGGQPPSKFQVAGRVVAALGYAALCRADRLEVLGFADGLTAASPPLRHKSRWVRLLEFLAALDLQERQTDLARAAESFARSRPRRGPVVVVSDLLDPSGFYRGLEILRRHGYWPRVAHVFDPREAEPGAVGDVELLDAETGRCRQATITPRMQRRYRELVAEFHNSVRTHCRRQGIPLAQIDCTAPEGEIWSALQSSPRPLGEGTVYEPVGIAR